jgi:hypothetical protein
MASKVLFLTILLLPNVCFVALVNNKPHTTLSSKIDTPQVKMAMSKTANKIVVSTNYYFVVKKYKPTITKLQDVILTKLEL